MSCVCFLEQHEPVFNSACQTEFSQMSMKLGFRQAQIAGSWSGHDESWLSAGRWMLVSLIWVDRQKWNGIVLLKQATRAWWKLFSRGQVNAEVPHWSGQAGKKRCKVPLAGITHQIFCAFPPHFFASSPVTTSCHKMAMWLEGRLVCHSFPALEWKLSQMLREMFRQMCKTVLRPSAMSVHPINSNNLHPGVFFAFGLFAVLHCCPALQPCEKCPPLSCSKQWCECVSIHGHAALVIKHQLSSVKSINSFIHSFIHSFVLLLFLLLLQATLDTSGGQRESSMSCKRDRRWDFLVQLILACGWPQGCHCSVVGSWLLVLTQKLKKRGWARNLTVQFKSIAWQGQTLTHQKAP